MWGEVDPVWTIIFIIIVLAFVYWAYIVYTRPWPIQDAVPPEIPPAD